MRTLFLTSLLLLAAYWTNAQELPQLELTPNATVQFTGNVSDGAVIDDLSWAWNSSVACFPATQSHKFRGKHVLYVVDVPRYSELTIKLIPADENANFSLYAYEVGKVSENNTVPNLNSCIRCEVDHLWDYARRGKTQDHTRTVDQILAINNPYQAVIGVVGPEGWEAGDFTLEIEMKSR